MMSSLVLSSLLFFAGYAAPLYAFQINRLTLGSPQPWCLFSKPDATTELVLSLEKPLGLILEEAVEGEERGVLVSGIGEGSASFSTFKDQLVGCRLSAVMEQDVSRLGFDEVMAVILDSPSTVTLKFEQCVTKDLPAPETKYELGTKVLISVIDGTVEQTIEASVGDNLRKTLLKNDFEVYKGLKQKLGNCGGAGQCTFCAVTFDDSAGWEERSEYEATKLKERPGARLSCLNNIQGPAKIRLTS